MSNLNTLTSQLRNLTQQLIDAKNDLAKKKELYNTAYDDEATYDDAALVNLQNEVDAAQDVVSDITADIEEVENEIDELSNSHDSEEADW
jgi:chromosome segregation ATPase